MKTPLSKFLLILIVGIGICGVALAFVLTGGLSGQRGRQAGSADPHEEGAAKDSVLPPTDSLLAEFCQERDWLVTSGLTGNDPEAQGHLVRCAAIMRERSDLVEDLTGWVLASGDPDGCGLLLLALGMARTPEATKGLLEILQSDLNSKIKAVAGCSCALAQGGRTIMMPLPGGSIKVNVVPIRDEAVLQALQIEWDYTEDSQAREVLFELMEISAAGSHSTAMTLWGWILEGRDGRDVLRRAADMAAALKGNPRMQNSLLGELLDDKNSDQIRLAAARILKESSVPTSEDVKEVLTSSVSDPRASISTKGFALHGMDSSTRTSVELQGLNEVIASREVPDDVRLSAMKEVRRRARASRGTGPSDTEAGGEGDGEGGGDPEVVEPSNGE